MSNLFDASRGCPFKGRHVMFDTNVWFAIEGFNYSPNDYRQKIYSKLYGQIRDNENIVVINDYVIAEFFNRSLKTEYELLKESWSEAQPIPTFKKIRSTNLFSSQMETIRDTCLNIVEDCEYVPINGASSDISKVITESSQGNMDFSDVLLRDHCIEKGYAVVSHDFDFANCGIDLITANAKILATTKRAKSMKN
jgi:predicted nucleic acid-binding protein